MKLYKLTVQLLREQDNKKYEQEIFLSIPAPSEILARSDFLESINAVSFFSHEGLFWPMRYTRAIIHRCEESGAVKKALSICPISTPKEKKVRKPRSPNKTKQVGIKASGKKGR
jgi:hypothetical protein